MKLKDWLHSDIRNPCVFNFDVFDVGEQYDYNDDVIAFLANLVVCARGNHRIIVDGLRRLIEDTRS